MRRIVDLASVVIAGFYVAVDSVSVLLRNAIVVCRCLHFVTIGLRDRDPNLKNTREAYLYLRQDHAIP